MKKDYPNGEQKYACFGFQGSHKELISSG